MGQPTMFFKKVTATGADQLVECGFVPRVVHVQNQTDLGEFDWFEGMTADHALYTDGATGIQTEVSSNGITQFQGDTIPSVDATTGEFTQAEQSFALTVGTSIVVTAGANTLAGTGTLFLSELFVGDEVIINSERHTIKSIDSNTVATTEKAFVSSATATAGTRVSLHEAGFKIGADSNMNAANDVLYCVAWA